MYWPASAVGIQAANTCRKNSQAMNAIENGFTSQLTKSVTNRPRGRLPTCRMEAKSTFIIIGTIISQIRTAIGMLIWLPAPNSIRRKASAAPGIALPSSTPTIMQARHPDAEIALEIVQAFRRGCLSDCLCHSASLRHLYRRLTITNTKKNLLR